MRSGCCHIAIATGAVRIRAPLPPLLPGDRFSLALATSRKRSDRSSDETVATMPKTALLWMPMSFSRAGE